jgi:hypothetical protein
VRTVYTGASDSGISGVLGVGGGGIFFFGWDGVLRG